MRWKFREGKHDPRQVDLLAALALVIAIIAAGYYFDQPKPPAKSAFIEPSQSVRW
jgi:hypothetical protein